jgi:hypothetical protein
MGYKLRYPNLYFPTDGQMAAALWRALSEASPRSVVDRPHVNSASRISGRFDCWMVVRELRKALAVHGWAVVREPHRKAVVSRVNASASS